MESYLEISLIHNIWTIYLSLQMAMYASLQPISRHKRLTYSTIISTAGCLCWFVNSYMLMIIIEITLLIVLFRFQFKTYFMAFAVRMLYYASAYIFLNGAFHNGIYFVAININIIYLWLIYLLNSFMIWFIWKEQMSQANYIYQVCLVINRKKLHLKGYLDSGNLITYKGKGIVFLDKKYLAYFKNANIELIVMNTLNQTTIIRCYETCIQISGCTPIAIYVNCDRDLNLPFRCDVLLNMKVMTEV